jgi:hypothetical protein
MKYFYLVIILVFLFVACSQNSENQNNKSEEAQLDSSFNAFLANFRPVVLPLRQDSIRLPLDKKNFIKDYFLRNFLSNDKTSNIEGYLIEYADAMQDEAPWNFAWYDLQFPVNENIIAIIYHTYKQVSVSNGGTYQSMIATFDKTGKMIQCTEIAEQTIYLSANTLSNEQEGYTTFSSIRATTNTRYDIDKNLIISILQTKNEEVYQEIQDTQDSTLLAKNKDTTFTKQGKAPEIIQKQYKILASGKISKV